MIALLNLPTTRIWATIFLVKQSLKCACSARPAILFHHLSVCVQVFHSAFLSTETTNTASSEHSLPASVSSPKRNHHPGAYRPRVRLGACTHTRHRNRPALCSLASKIVVVRFFGQPPPSSHARTTHALHPVYRLTNQNLSPTNEQDRPFAERACIPATEVIDVLDNLSGTLIFNTATSQERLALASRLRHWVVADGTYLIREGDGDRNRSAIFMIGGSVRSGVRWLHDMYRV